MIRKLYSDTSIEDFLSESAGWKQKADHLSGLFLADDWLQSRGVKMSDCGHWLVFDRAGTDVPPPAAAEETAPAFQLTRSNFCRQRLCPMCQWRRSRMIFAQLTDVVDKLREDGYDALHLVLTVRNVRGSQLRDQITRMYKAFSSLTHEPMLKGWKGSLRFLEVSYNRDERTYHPHLHVLVVVRKSYFASRYYVKQEQVVRLWRAALGVDYDPMCHIRKCDPRAILEVAKYCVKPFDFAECDPAETLRIYRCFDFVLHSRRLIQSYGVMRQVIRDCKLDDTLDDEPDREYTVDDLKDQLAESRYHLVYAYNPDARRYELN